MRLAHVKWDHVPASQAETSWDLLLEVINAVRGEPKRIFMNAFIQPPYDDDSDGYKFGSCNTMGCVAGWYIILHDRESFDARGFRNMPDRAMQLLPFQVYEDWDQLVSGMEPYPWPKAPQGTTAYAKAVVANIEKFMAANEAYLKAFALPSIATT